MSRRRTFGLIRTLSSGRYQARYTSPDGARHRAPRSFATKAEASQWLAKIETEFARGTWTDPDAGRVSLDGCARGWVETRANLRPRTVDLYESLLERHIVPALGDHSGRRRRTTSGFPVFASTTCATRATPSPPRPARAPAS